VAIVVLLLKEGPMHITLIRRHSVFELHSSGAFHSSDSKVCAQWVFLQRALKSPTRDDPAINSEGSPTGSLRDLRNSITLA
jgi:hypothetical protein